jgi:dTDP-glucose 4,6-dehydratase
VNLLITGGAGFIGSHFVRHALTQRPDRVVNLDCLTYAGRLENLRDIQKDPRYHFEQVDLRDLLAVRRTLHEHRITHVVHLAAESHVDRSIEAPAPFITTNVLGTFNLLEACRESGGVFKRFLHVSTDEVYGALGPAGLFTESSPYAPNSPYSASKAASDLLVRAYCQTYGLDAVITHASNNFGPAQHEEKLIPLVIRCLVQRKAIPVYGNGRQVRDWIYVKDHARALYELLLRGRSGERYNIGAQNEWPNVQLVELICDLFDGLAPALGGSSRSLITFVQDRPGHDWRYALDTTKICREIAWEPEHSFQPALRETIQWYLTKFEA